MSEPKDLRYTKNHEWARIAGDAAEVGITNYAQEQLGDIVYVDLPAPGDSMTQGEVFGTVESVKAVSDLYAPVSGEVTEVNEFLADAPEVVNHDPYGKGWMVKVKVADAGEAANLMSPEDYDKHVEAEKGKG